MTARVDPEVSKRWWCSATHAGENYRGAYFSINWRAARDETRAAAEEEAEVEEEARPPPTNAKPPPPPRAW
jgi:hypothetical protein